MHTLNFFTDFVFDHRYLGYALLFAAMMIEGELFLTAAGMLARFHAFDFSDAFLFAFLGALAGDILWYGMGRYLQKHHSRNRYLIYATNKVRMILPGIEKNPYHVVFISKFLYGLNHSTILVLGYLNIGFKHFLQVQLLTSLVWSIIFLTIGYLFGEAALSFTHRLDKLVVLAILFFIALLIAERIVRLVVRKKEREG